MLKSVKLWVIVIAVPQSYFLLIVKILLQFARAKAKSRYYGGTYSTIKGKVVLSYDTLQVDRDYNWEADVDTTQTSKPEFSITLNKAKASIETLTPQYCNGKLYFEAGTNEEKSFGTIDSRYSLKEYIKMLKEEGVWEQIQH